MFASMDFGKRLKALRKAAGLTQEELARRAKIKQGTVSDLERGESKAAHSETLIALAAVLECSPEWLTTGKGSPTPPVSVDPEQAELISIFVALPEALRTTLMTTARSLLDATHTEPSRLNPFPKARA